MGLNALPCTVHGALTSIFMVAGVISGHLTSFPLQWCRGCSISVPVSHDTLLLRILAWVAAQINNRFVINKQRKYKTKLYHPDYMRHKSSIVFKITFASPDGLHVSLHTCRSGADWFSLATNFSGHFRLKKNCVN